MARNQLHFEGEMCEECGENPKGNAGYMLDGSKKYRAICNHCHRSRYLRPHLQFRGTSCEMCDYTPMFARSLDVHHRDGDHKNNDLENLMTVCATCHRELEALIHDLEGDRDKAESLFKKFMKAIIG